MKNELGAGFQNCQLSDNMIWILSSSTCALWLEICLIKMHVAKMALSLTVCMTKTTATHHSHAKQNEAFEMANTPWQKEKKLVAA